MARDDKIPEDCSKSWLLKVYKGKEDPLTYNSCHEVGGASYENERVIEEGEN